MRPLPLILLPLLAVCGCATYEKPVVHPTGWQDETFAAYAVLRREPVPYPAATRYQQDPTANGIYLHGFSLGWDEGLRACFPLRSTPFDVPLREDTDKIWREGYSAGARLATDRLLQYRMYPKPSPQGPANGSQPSGSETNRTSEAAGSRRSP